MRKGDATVDKSARMIAVIAALAVFLYIVSFMLVGQYTHVTFVPGYKPAKACMGFWFSHDRVWNWRLYCFYWPLARLLEFSGVWVFLLDDMPDFQGGVLMKGVLESVFSSASNRSVRIVFARCE